MPKLKAGILGATGAAGLEFVRALRDHPWFQVERLYASEKSAGKTFGEACTFDASDLPEEIRRMPVALVEQPEPGLDFVCSALPSESAGRIEAMYAEHMPVLSTSSAHRYEDDVPILITEINAEHAELLKIQQARRGWKGWIAPGPNCTTVGLVMSLWPIYDIIGLERVAMSSCQSVSGGGYPLVKKWRDQRRIGLPEPLSDPGEPIANPDVMLDGNVIGEIPGEEDKVRREAVKILGELYTDRIRPAEFRIDCSCVRVPTLKGHFENVFLETSFRCSPETIRNAYRAFNEKCRKLYGDLPSSPREAVLVLDRSPQPFYDANLGGGMTTVVGRIEACEAFGNGIKYQVLSNNTEKGAAKGMVQVAEYLHREGFLK